MTRLRQGSAGQAPLREGSAGQAPAPQRRGAPKRPLEAEARRNAGRVALRRHAEEPEPLGPVGAFATGCRWIHGEVAAGDWRCCGHDTEPGSPWCPHYASRVYNAAATAQSRKI